MTREEAKKLLPIIQAFAEGKTIQWRDLVKDTWVDESVPNWNPSAEYRIKPEPREVWVAVTESGGIGHSFRTERSAKDWIGNASQWQAIKFREVMDE